MLKNILGIIGTGRYWRGELLMQTIFRLMVVP